MSKRKDMYIECLDEDGWHLELDNNFNKKRSKRGKKWKKVCFFFIFLYALSLLFDVTYSKYASKTNGDSSIEVATWNFKINSDYSKNINIDLADTIVENNYSTTKVIPGTKGVIQLNIDFSGSKVATSYSILRDDSLTVLPENLKFYSDSNMTLEFTGFTGNISLDQIDQVVSKKIYWKWDFTDMDETEAWANKDIKFELEVIGEQDV